MKEYETIKRDHKNKIFIDLFENNKSALLDLFNAIMGTDFDDASKIEIVTIKDGMFTAQYNDLAFVFSDVLSLYEHQSTLCGNMPLRMLCYVAEEFQKIAEENEESIYGPDTIKLPSPNLVVFYNGEVKTAERVELKLSDAYSNKWFSPKLDLSVTMININSGHNKELMDKCPLLYEYAEFVKMAHEYAKSDDNISTSMKTVIDRCIAEGILSEYLKERRSEVLGSLIREFDQEKYERSIKRKSFEEGIEQGKGDVIKNLLETFDSEKVAELLKISIEEVEEVIQKT